MNQPKFNYGDKVIIKADRSRFIVFAIAYDNESGYYYRDEYRGSDFFKEEELELYQEPQKLYAYRAMGKLSEIKFFTFEIGEGLEMANNMSRDPKYDIEYNTNQPHIPVLE